MGHSALGTSASTLPWLMARPTGTTAWTYWAYGRALSEADVSLLLPWPESQPTQWPLFDALTPVALTPHAGGCCWV